MRARPHILLCIIVFPFVVVASISGTDNHLDFADHISINCGSTESFSQALDGNGAWLEDHHYPKKLTATSSIAIGGSSSTTVDLSAGSVDSVPYKTARISRSKFSYRFQLDPGQKYIRLHFNPTSSYDGFQKFRDSFNVEANQFTLLSNFSPSMTAKYLGIGTFVKEFCVSTVENQALDIVFSLSDDYYYAFVNAIEILSIPAAASPPYCHSGDNGVQVIGLKSVVYVDEKTALEMVQRQNLIVQRMALPFRRSWSTTTRLKEKENTWKFSVDVGFQYMVKLHFAEVGRFGNFTILINRVVACTDAEIIQQMKELPRGVRWHTNYVVTLRGRKKEDKRDISISIEGHIPLEGFEVFKLSNLENSLASPNFLAPIQSSLPVSDTRKRTIALVVVLLCLINMILFEFRQIWVPETINRKGKNPSKLDESPCRYFSLAEIKSATENFSDALIIGKGGFGNVYRGLIDEEKQTVAIKRLKPDSRQGQREFWKEIEVLSKLRHVNLVSLIGYCNEEGEVILVYEHMPRGTLADYLYKRDGRISVRSSLTWKQRLLICIGAARGLEYLHTGHRVIHRDVKSSNILLDEKLVAKVSDFGLAKTQVGRDTQTQDSTDMKGTEGYIDPDFFRTRTVTRKSDTYSFGVVLLEVMCGRKALDRSYEDGRRRLTAWARDNLSKGDTDAILDPRLRGQISPGSLKAFVKIAEMCFRDSPKKRPRMAHVVMNLEFALMLQENANLSVMNSAFDIFPNGKIQLETTKASEKNSYRVLFSRKTFSNVLSGAAPRVSATSRTMNSAPENKNGKLFSKLKRSQFWPFDGFGNKAKESKDFAGISVSATLSHSKKTVSHSRLKGAFRQTKRYGAIENNGLLPPSPDLKVFSFSELKKATSNFSTKIGQGGFGSVYKGWFSKNAVAIKMLTNSSRQGFNEWQSEITYLGRLSHPNLVKLLGYCRKKKQLLLVYEFIENGALESHLFGSGGALSWDVRLKILTGVARGLAFLHDGTETKIIHRDVKPSNILLDESYNAKLSDFGLARSGPVESETHVSTMIKGTYGCIDPEYLMTGHLNVKSDVYAFGVCVLVLLTGLRAADMLDRSGEKGLLGWVEPLLSMEQKLERVIIDPRLEGNYPTMPSFQIASLALNCVEREPNKRPSMRQAVEILERKIY